MAKSSFPMPVLLPEAASFPHSCLPLRGGKGPEGSNGCSAPLRKPHGAARAGRRAVAGHVVDQRHVELLYRSRRGNPIPDLGGPRVQPSLWQLTQSHGILRLHGLEDLMVELFIDDEVAQPA